MERAPFFDDLTPAPPGAEAFWVSAADGVRLRLGQFGPGPRGTVLCFPGRTEYIEKYAPVAVDLAKAGLGMVAIDWRGQGLADRLIGDPLLGHVEHFLAYQTDVEALVDFAKAQNLPRPWYLLAHSMGGAIGLRALQEGLDVTAAVFSAPMWGIAMPPVMGHIAPFLARLAAMAGLAHTIVPGTGRKPYVLTATPEDNTLTSDPDTFRWFQTHLKAQPGLGLGGPTYHWLRCAMSEIEHFAHSPLPDLPALVFLGDREQIVRPDAIHSVTARWPSARLVDLAGSEHELLMERPEIRQRAIDETLGFFAQHGA